MSYGKPENRTIEDFKINLNERPLPPPKAEDMVPPSVSPFSNRSPRFRLGDFVTTATGEPAIIIEINAEYIVAYGWDDLLNRRAIYTGDSRSFTHDISAYESNR